MFRKPIENKIKPEIKESRLINKKKQIIIKTKFWMIYKNFTYHCEPWKH